jgi:excisionase family DNA binding protein
MDVDVVTKLRAMKGLLSVRQISEMLGYHKMTLYSWVAAGKIPHLRIEGTIRFDPNKLAVWLQERSS